MWNLQNFQATMGGQHGQHRNFSAHHPEKIFARPDVSFNLNEFSMQKQFINTRINQADTKQPGTIYEKCSKFINSSNGYPHNIRKEPTKPLDIAENEMNTKRNAVMHCKRQSVWHKPPEPMDFEQIDEVGVECEEMQSSPRCFTATLQDFIEKSSPVQIILTNSSPIRIKIGTPVYFSVSPPRPVCFKKRSPPLCISDDNFVIFAEDSDCEDDEESNFDEDETSSDEYSESESDNDIDFNDNSWKGTPKTDDGATVTQKNVKKVRFADEKNLVEVHHMHVWPYAYQASRKGHWEEYARDRERFKRRIETCGAEIDKILNCKHRQTMYMKRFVENAT